MIYIELPQNIKSLEQNQEGYHYFISNDTCYYLHLIAAQATQGIFRDLSTGLELTVTQTCPAKNREYVEYLPRTDNKPSQWVKIHIGLEKTQLIEIVSRRDVDRVPDWFGFLSPVRQSAVNESRAARVEDRRTKGAKSV